MVIFYIILAVVVAATAVVLVKVFNAMHITAFAATALVAMLLPLPTYAITTAAARDDQQTFHEYWNGYEVSADTSVVTCRRDGSCQHTFSCDPYQVTEMETYTVYETQTYTDSEGHMKTRSVPKQKQRPVTKTKYHSCPYSKQETTYSVNTTLGGYTVESHLMTGEPWRWGHSIPGGQVTKAPDVWTAVQKRIADGNPGGVTKVSNYKNYILASDNLFKRYSDKVDQLQKKGLLPAPTVGVSGMYDAQKVSFLGNMHGAPVKALAKDMPRLNGAVGTQLRGDVRVVFVDADKMTDNPEDYANAVMAYWQSKQLGRDALAKNTVAVLVGVKGYEKPAQSEVSPTAAATPTASATASAGVPAEPVIKPGTPVVAWAKAFTGMPIGNEALLQQFNSELPGTVIDKNFLGSPKFNPSNSTITHTNGVIEGMLYGENKFQRVSMTAKDAGDVGSGFAYLGQNWQPDTGTLVTFYIIASILFTGALIGGSVLTMNLAASRSIDPIKMFLGKGKN